MVLVQKEVKAVYLGTHKVWPPSLLDYSTTFDTSDGWTLNGATISNGEMSGQLNNRWTHRSITPIGGNDISKITIETTCTGTAGGWNGGMFIGISAAIYDNSTMDSHTDFSGFYINYTAAGGYNQTGVQFAHLGGYTQNSIITTTKYGGQHLWKLEIDVVNKTGTIWVDGTQVATGVLPDADITMFKSYTYNYIAIPWDSRNDSKSIQDLHITVE